MSASLLIDCGNSRCKWGRLAGDGISGTGDRRYSELDQAQQLLDAWCSAGRFERVYLASVKQHQIIDQALELLVQRDGIRIHRIETRQGLAGLQLAYRHIETLGVDRWLAMLAAMQVSPQALCVVDVGTAMTVDIVSAERQHLGGQIIPGLELMRNSLHHGTAQLPKAGSGQGQGVLGVDTEQCIAAGSLTALAGAVNLIREEVAYLGEIHGIITGGNAGDVLPLLRGQWEHRPQLVLEGMAFIDGEKETGDAQ